MSSKLILSPVTLRRFVLGQQGLWPGRRWQGKAGAAEALQRGCVIQIDPLNIIARNHDTSLYGRVLDYKPAQFNELLYSERAGFDYGGTVFVHPMEELPYWRVVMERCRRRGRWGGFADTHPQVIAEVLSEVKARGPLMNRDFKGNAVGHGNYRGTKDTALAMYYLWYSGELMTWGRRDGNTFERLYDLRERVAPPALNYAVTPDEADAYFARRTFRHYGLSTAREFRLRFSGAIERRVEEPEANERLAAWLADGTIAQVWIAADPKHLPHYVLAEDLPFLETLHAGQVPQTWLPLQTTTTEEMTVLAPLEIASARGRAKALFDFDYVWEVYKPVELRRWGYYTLPLLWGDRLVARFDSRLDRDNRCLKIFGFWVEPDVPVDAAFRSALQAGLKRFVTFLGAERVDSGEFAL
jgi:uncharacterized protein YcaQ